MKGKRFFAIQLAMLSVALLSAGGQQDQKTRVFKISIGLPENHFETDAFKLFEQYVEEKTEGAFDVQLFPGAQLGNDKDALELIQQGVIQMNPTGTSYLANFEKSYNILSSPYLFKNQEDVDKLLNGQFGQELLKTLDKVGFIGLGFGSLGFTNLSNSKRPIVQPEDIEGIKLRTIPNPFLLDFFRTIGANPVPMGLGEVFTALQQGVADGQFNPLTTILSNKFYEVQPFISLSTDIVALVVLVMDKGYFEALSPEEQTIIRQGARMVSDYMREKWQEQEQQAYDTLVTSGSQIIEVPASTKKAWFLKGFDVIERYGKQSNPELFEILKREMNLS